MNRVSMVNGDTKPATDGGAAGGEALKKGVEERGSHVSGASEGVRVRVGIAGPEGEERGESVWADAVIVAVPLSLLQQGVVQFDPPIPEVMMLGNCSLYSGQLSSVGDGKMLAWVGRREFALSSDCRVTHV